MNSQLTRRTFLGGMAAPAVLPALLKAAPKPTILLRSGWQTINIGDIAHTPGMLRLLMEYLPEARVILWPNSVDRGVAPMLQKAFPELRIIRSGTKLKKWNEDPEVLSAFEEATLMLHGSGPSIVAQESLFDWKSRTSKPYGIFGVTFTPPASDRLYDMLSGSKFLYTRETTSLENLKKVGVDAPVMGFTPDATFSMDLRDDEKGLSFLREAGLERRKFIAVIPRLRYTPYHLIRKTNLSSTETERRMAVNDQFKEVDHAKLREAMVAWVRKTGNKVLLCPEMTYELDIIDPLLYDPLPEDVKSKVVRRKTYWLPDEAASVYSQASVVISCECHSPILAVSQGTPCFYVHEAEDGIKGQMWRDVGLGQWYFEMDKTTGAELAQKLLSVHHHYDEALKTVVRARDFARAVKRKR